MPKKSTNVSGVLGLDPTLPDVTLTVAGKTYKLCFCFNACAHVQAATGVNVFAAQADASTLDPIKFRAMLWASLLLDQPDMKIEDAGRLITPRTLPLIAEAVNKAWTESQAEPTEGNG